MEKFTVGQAVVILVLDNSEFPVDTQGIVEEVHWEYEKPNHAGVRGCYKVRVSDAPYDCWNYYDTEIAPVEGAQ